MTARKVWWSGAWLELGGAAGSATDQYPSNPLADQVNVAASTRTPQTITGHATPFSDGTYVELDASLSANAAGIYVYVDGGTNANGADSSTLLEIATGAAASEAAWASIGVGYRTSSTGYFVPGHIAAGTRVSARVRSVTTLKAVTVHCSFLTPKDPAPSAPVTYGANTSTARGVDVAGTSVNTKSSWVEITASTSAAHTQLLVTPQGGGDGGMAAADAVVDIGIGAGGAETVLIGDILLKSTVNEAQNPGSPLTYGVTIPAGSRLSARWARANTGNSLDIILVGA